MACKSLLVLACVLLVTLVVRPNVAFAASAEEQQLTKATTPATNGGGGDGVGESKQICQCPGSCVCCGWDLGSCTSWCCTSRRKVLSYPVQAKAVPHN